jgi:Family of unknown function (DUF6011)
MARCFCRYNHNHGDDIAAARYCTGSPPSVAATRPVQTIDPARPRTVIHVFEAPTGPMLDFVERLPGGDVELARLMNRGQCGDYIKRLKDARDATPSVLSMAMASRRPAGPTLIPVGLLTEVADGRYAVRADDTLPWCFLRLTRPRSGNFAGMLKVQSQHAERYALVLTVNPSDQIKWYDRRLENNLLLLIADQQWAAIMYSQEKKLCCRCGTQLTHEDSMKYGIGPECIKHWPWVPERLAQYKAERDD